MEEQLETYKRLHEKGPQGEKKEILDRVNKWLAPSQGWYRANWDVAIDNSKARVGMGVILRDERGQVLVAMSKTRNGTLEPSAGEAFAASSAVCFCKDLGVQRVVLEGDAKQIVDAINSSSTSWSRFGHLIDDTRWILKCFPQWKCQFVCC